MFYYPLHYAEVAPILLRINTAPLRRPDAPTVALVVFNLSEYFAPPGRVRFATTFMTKETPMVTVRDDNGMIVPSWIQYSQSIAAIPNQPPPEMSSFGVELEFALGRPLPPRTARAYAASFEKNPLPLDREKIPMYPLPVFETRCQEGELPLEFALPESFNRQ